MKCSICDKKKKTLIRCEECGAKFCPECGDEEREWCDLCLKFEETQKNNISKDS